MSAQMKVQASVFIIACCSLLACSRYQPPKPDDPYREVPARDRESLRGAVRQFVDLQKTSQWEEMYKLLDEPKDPKDKFLRRRAELPVLKDFSPTLAAWIPDGWTITGCGLFQYRGQPVRALVSSLRVRPKDSEWYFTPVGIEVFPGEPGSVKSCALSSPH